MSDLNELRRTVCAEATHEAFLIIESLQWHKHRSRLQELQVMGRAIWRLTTKLNRLRGIYNAQDKVS
jgi:hypothetical protein